MTRLARLIALSDKLALIFGVSGAICVGERLSVGYILFILAGVCKIVVLTNDNRYYMMLACIIFLFIDMYYFIDWFRL